MALASGSRSSDTLGTELFPMQNGFDQFHGGFLIGDLDDQLIVAIILQLNDDCVLWIMNVPEYALAILIKRTSGDHTGNAGSAHLQAMPPSTGNTRVGADTCDMVYGD